MKLHSKDLNNISVVHHWAIKPICGHNSYDNYHECLEYARLPIFKHFFGRKFKCYAQKLFTSKSPCLMNHKHYLRYNSVFRNSLERFFSENYQVTNGFDNPMCSMLCQNEFVKRTKLRSIGYEPGWMCYKNICNGNTLAHKKYVQIFLRLLRGSCNLICCLQLWYCSPTSDDHAFLCTVIGMK